MDDPNIKLCTEIVQQFSASTQILIGAIATIVLNMIVLIRAIMKSRSE